MLDDIFQAIFSIIDVTGTVAGTENKSLFLKIIGILVWLCVLAGIVWVFVKGSSLLLTHNTSDNASRADLTPYRADLTPYDSFFL